MLNLLNILRKSLILGLILNFVLIPSVFANEISLTVLNTTKATEAYYSVNGVDEYTLLLKTPSDVLYHLPIEDLNKISANYLNELGEYTLYLRSDYKGVKDVIIAKDTFTVSLKSKFLASFGIGGDLVTGDSFQFLGIPAEVSVGQNFNFTLRALNELGEVDIDYLGEVEFSVISDSGVTLPANYQFTEEDAGTHVFSGETSFATAGEHLIQVKDLADDTLLGQIDITVNSNQSELDEIEGQMQVVSPLSGDINNNVVKFAGRVDPGLQIKILANNELLMTAEADSEGNFDVDSPVLSDGSYIFVLKTTNASSQEIQVNIDASAKILSSFTFSNDDPQAGDIFKIDINLADSISAARVLLDEKYYDLISSDLILAKSFTGELKAPETSGVYPLDLVLTLTSGEDVEIKDIAVLDITADMHPSAGDEGETFFVPSKVLEVKATPSDRSITLSWSPATDNTGIANYLIRYGLDKNNLDLSVYTEGAQTVWYIPDLDNGKNYYFQIYAVDTEGNLSDQASDLIFLAPGTGGAATTMHGSGEDQVIVEETSQTGPEIYFLLLLSALIAKPISKRNVL